MSSTHIVIDSLEEMEAIVATNQHLEWDGWTVVEYHQRPASLFDPNAVYRNGRWYKVSRYDATEVGWSIPTRLYSGRVRQSVEG